MRVPTCSYKTADQISWFLSKNFDSKFQFLSVWVSTLTLSMVSHNYSHEFSHWTSVGHRSRWSSNRDNQHLFDDTAPLESHGSNGVESSKMVVPAFISIFKLGPVFQRLQNLWNFLSIENWVLEIECWQLNTKNTKDQNRNSKPQVANRPV